jgi:DNA-binding transcriptional LysR family regulator
MLFDNIRLFRDIAQARSISRGAGSNQISQSAASQHVQELERKLRVSLLDRSTRPLTLTPAGKLYADFCRDVLRREEEFTAQLDAERGRGEGAVRVASIYSVGLSELPRLRREFEARFPTTQLHIDFLRPDKLYEAVLDDRADLGLVSYPEATRHLAAEEWRKEVMTVAACPAHSLAKRRRLGPADLAGQDFVSFDEELTIRRELDRYFREQSVEITIAAQFDNIQSVKEAVELGQGISILPECTFLLEIEQGRLVSIPLEDPALVRPVGIVYRKRKTLTRAARSFLDLLRGKPAPAATGEENR